jgi:DNA/RNA-binding domain of Phe-tRNA-synthetase-like protein
MGLPGLIVVSSELAGLGVFVSYAVVRGVRVSETPGFVDEMLRVEEERVRSVIGDASRLTENPIVQAYRRFMWRLGIDPTKVRPSSEALARRVLHGGSIPRINSIVDIGNLVSLKTLIPIGLYDLDTVSPPLVLKLSEGYEEFAPIGSQGVERLRRGLPIIVDSRGLVIHIYPHRDSRYSMITVNTRNMLVVSCGVPGVPRALVTEATESVVKLVKSVNPTVEVVEVGVAPGGG